MAAGKELVALADGFVSRRSGGLICCAVAARGMTAPVLAVGDGPLGFCKPLRETFPEITTQRYVAQDGQCARSAAESAQRGAKAALAEN